MGTDPKLKDGSSVAIIGAGPAGCFFALAARKLSREIGIGLDIVLFDGKDFLQKGPVDCDFCSALIPESLIRRLSALGIEFPDEGILRTYHHFVLHTRFGAAAVRHPDPKRRIITVNRGDRPRFSRVRGELSFDDFLLEHLRRHGASIVSQPVEEVMLPPRPAQGVKISYGIGDSPDEAAFDLVVGAFGLSRSTIRNMERMGFGYQAPETTIGFQGHVSMSRQTMQDFYQGAVHILGPGLVSSVPYAEFIPGETGVTVGGRADGKFGRKEFVELLRESKKHGLVPETCDENSDHCYCTRRVALTHAKKPYSDRLVIVGEAAYSRFRGDRIGSALATSELAARIAVSEGVDAQTFARSYTPEAKRSIVRDNSYAKAAHLLNRFFCSNALFGRGQKEMLSDPDDSGGRKLRELLWDFYAHETSYRALSARLLAPDVFLRRFLSAASLKSHERRPL